MIDYDCQLITINELRLITIDELRLITIDELRLITVGDLLITIDFSIVYAFCKDKMVM